MRNVKTVVLQEKRKKDFEMNLIQICEQLLCLHDFYLDFPDEPKVKPNRKNMKENFIFGLERLNVRESLNRHLREDQTY